MLLDQSKLSIVKVNWKNEGNLFLLQKSSGRKTMPSNKTNNTIDERTTTSHISTKNKIKTTANIKTQSKA